MRAARWSNEAAAFRALKRSGGSARAARFARYGVLAACWYARAVERARLCCVAAHTERGAERSCSVKTCFAAGPRELYRLRWITHMFLGTLRCYERVFVQAAAATSVSSPMEDERRTNSARPRIASARAACAALARSSTKSVEAPSRTKLLRRSIITGAPVERGVGGSELAVESMASTSSRRARSS